MVKRLATSPHDPLGITDSACKNQSVVVSVQYGPFNPYIPIRSTTIGKSRVAIDLIAMHTSWRLNSDIASVTSIGYPRMSASGESSTTMHRLPHASGSHPIPTPYDPKLVDFITITTTTTLNLEARASAPFSSKPHAAAAGRRLSPPPPPLVAAAAAASSPEIVPAKFDEKNPSVPISSVLLVHADEGVSHLVVDRIDVVYRNLP
ncbi:hypothetical protein F511_27631 [Dorcoceras hygrometricum]|uniref:Uncharacterized protein n=1 Tax=Dorcoceras hygrometricum TaxID=472368 RepID=A0A2Z7D1B4_9LAMI|nr:hypothetical protein F511_27631 [Dorcoceras hygrometricum]